MKLKGADKPLLEGALWQKIKVAESLWMVEEEDTIYEGRPYIMVYLFKWIKRDLGTGKGELRRPPVETAPDSARRCDGRVVALAASGWALFAGRNAAVGLLFDQRQTNPVGVKRVFCSSPEGVGCCC